SRARAIAGEFNRARPGIKDLQVPWIISRVGDAVALQVDRGGVIVSRHVDDNGAVLASIRAADGIRSNCQPSIAGDRLAVDVIDAGSQTYYVIAGKSDVL